jgi:hypothetical protein
MISFKQFLKEEETINAATALKMNNVDESTYNDGPWPCTCGFEEALKTHGVGSASSGHTA